MNSLNRVRPAVQFQCVSLCPFVYVQIVREPGKAINHIPKRKAVVERYWNMCRRAGIAARLADAESQVNTGGSGGKRTDSAV